MKPLLTLLTLPALFLSTASLDARQIFWPMDDQGFYLDRPQDQLIQPTESGKTLSGTFGGVRNNGHRFHEGIDICSHKRDKSGKPTEKALAILPGKVVHINALGGRSSYGKYVVIEHEGIHPKIYSLYAHLRRIEPGLEQDQWVKEGTPLGMVGNTATGYKIPWKRAHLHFEIGVMLSKNFQKWYDKQKFGSKNYHRQWNGMNLIGLDPMAFYQAIRYDHCDSCKEFFDRQEKAFTVRHPSATIPDYAMRYPILTDFRGLTRSKIKGWEIDYTWYGLPVALRALSADEAPKKTQIINDKPASLKAHKCRKMVSYNGKREPQPTKLLLTQLDKLFVQ